MKGLLTVAISILSCLPTALIGPPATNVNIRGKCLAHLATANDILSREKPAMREALYQAIGFTPCAEIQLPASLQAALIVHNFAQLSPPDQIIYRAKFDALTHSEVPSKDC